MSNQYRKFQHELALIKKRKRSNEYKDRLVAKLMHAYSKPEYYTEPK